MTNLPDERNIAPKKIISVSNSLNIGAKVATRNYRIALPIKGSSVVNVFDTTRGAVKNGNTVGKWIFRIDGPHKNVDFSHININKAVSKIPDPHIPISGATLEGARTTAKIMKGVNKVMLPVAIVIDSARVGYNIYKDVKHKTSRNSVTTATSIAGGWGGGFGGAALGATIGSAIFPGIGTLIGGIIGGVSGGIGGSLGTEASVSAIGDACEWDIKTCICKKCEKKYKCRQYTDQPRDCCPDCENCNDQYFEVDSKFTDIKSDSDSNSDPDSNSDSDFDSDSDSNSTSDSDSILPPSVVEPLPNLPTEMP